MQTRLDFHRIMEAFGDGVIVCDAGGTIVFWNAASTRIFGFAPEEAVGQSLDLIIPPRQQQRHWEGFHRTMATGKTRYGSEVLRVPAVHKEGRPLSIAFSVALLHMPGAGAGRAAGGHRGGRARRHRALERRARPARARAGTGVGNGALSRPRRPRCAAAPPGAQETTPATCGRVVRRKRRNYFGAATASLGAGFGPPLDQKRHHGASPEPLPMKRLFG